MKVFHISDLHIGKQLYAYSLREEQEDILHQIVEHAAIHRPDAILIAGVYMINRCRRVRRMRSLIIF